MIEQVRVLARCGECHRAYRVPDPGRSYRCKACGGSVRAVAPPSREPVEGLNACTACRALNAPEAHFCVECGALLGPSAAPPTSREAARARMEASRALRRAYKGIDGVAWLYRFGALAYAAATVFAVLALVRTDVPLGPGVLVVCLTTLLSALMLMGAIQVPFRPFAWTLAVAVLATAVSAVHLVGPNPFGVAFLASAAWAAVAWAALVPTRRFRQLIAEHTDLYILHHAGKSTRRSLRGRFPRERHERLLAAMRRAAGRAWRVSSAAAGGLCLASAVSTWAVVAHLRPEELSGVQRDFEQTWNEQGLTAAVRFLHPRVRVREGARLAGVTEGLGWVDGLPRLEDGRTRREGGRATTEYDLGGLPATASWVLDGQGWSLTGLDLPTPPLEPVLDRFLQAWRASNAHALASFFSVGNQPKMLASIETAARNRGWERYPEVLGTRVTDSAEGRASVSIDLEQGQLETEWILRADGRWGLRGLRFLH